MEIKSLKPREKAVGKKKRRALKIILTLEGVG